MSSELRPKLSVIVPILNEEEVLPSLLAELRKCETGSPFPVECILVDGGSEDQSLHLCQAAQFSVISSERGRGHQLRKGATKAHGEVLLFLHADSQITPEHCRIAVESVQNNGIMAGGFKLEFDDNHPILKLAEWLNLVRFRITKVLYGDHGIFIRRDKYEAIGGFPKQSLFEDVELSRRLKKNGRLVLLTRSPIRTSARRFLAGGVVRTYLLMASLHILYWLGVSPEKLAKMYGQK